jgi:hypothetical protein
MSKLTVEQQLVILKALRASGKLEALNYKPFLPMKKD